MKYLRVYLKKEDSDIISIWTGLPRGERSEFVKKAIRRLAGQSEPDTTSDVLTALEVRKIIREELQMANVSSTSTSHTPNEEVLKENEAAVKKVLGMF